MGSVAGPAVGAVPRAVVVATPAAATLHAERPAGIWVAVDPWEITACYLDANAMARRKTMATRTDRYRIFVDAVRFDEARLIESISKAGADYSLLNIQ